MLNRIVPRKKPAKYQLNRSSHSLYVKLVLILNFSLLRKFDIDISTFLSILQTFR